jgi:hypothetical protein
MKSGIICVIGMVLALTPATIATMAYDDFSLSQSQHLDVTTNYGTGTLWDSSTANVIVSGYITSVYVHNEASLNYSGGGTNYLDAYDTSSVNFSGGGIGYLNAHDTSNVNVLTDTDKTGAAYITYLNAYNSSSVNVSGSDVYFLDALNSSTVNASGGFVNDISARDTSNVNVSGGTLQFLAAFNTSITTFYGHDFTFSGGDYDNPLWLNGNQLMGRGTLFGKWSDGTSFATDIYYHDTTATILLIPEPASLLLLSLGGILAIRKMR